MPCRMTTWRFTGRPCAVACEGACSKQSTYRAGRQHCAALGGDARARGNCEVPAAARRGQGHPKQAGQDAYRPVPALLEQRLPLHPRDSGMRGAERLHELLLEVLRRLASAARMESSLLKCAIPAGSVHTLGPGLSPDALSRCKGGRLGLVGAEQGIR